tara:strand:+ start:178 stop:393 length:216 start_codon:yes stop_codon:yes gene_type:complete
LKNPESYLDKHKGIRPSKPESAYFVNNKKIIKAFFKNKCGVIENIFYCFSKPVRIYSILNINLKSNLEKYS